MELETKRSVIEALIMSSPEPLPARKVAAVVDDLNASKIGKAVAELNQRYMEVGAAFRIRQLAGGYQFYIVPEFAGFVQELFTRRRKLRLTRAALETLAIVAYRQPVTKAEVEHVRGVASDGVIHNLLEKKLVCIKGRSDAVGKPLQYGTTNDFLAFFGINALTDLPQMSEIEEMIKAEEPQNQTELPLAPENGDEPAPEKLNIADGTFDPSKLEEDEETTNDNDAEDTIAIAPNQVRPVEESQDPPTEEPAEGVHIVQAVDEEEVAPVESEPVGEPMSDSGGSPSDTSGQGVVFDVDATQSEQ